MAWPTEARTPVATSAPREALGEHRGGVVVALHGEHAELVAAQAGDHVGGPLGRGDGLGGAAQQPVARRVAGAVVDQLQLVQVDRDQGRSSIQQPRPVRSRRPSRTVPAASRNAAGAGSGPTPPPSPPPPALGPAVCYSPDAFFRRRVPALRSVVGGLSALAASTLARSASIRSTTLEGSASSV